MFNVCYNCGEYRVDKIIDPTGPLAICPACEHGHPFRYLPILFVCGASGTGKSTLCAQLTGRIDEVVVLDGDILWQPEFNQPEESYRNFFETWLRMAKNIAQAGRPVVLFNAGANPDNVEPCVEQRYFSRACYLALLCDDDALTARLQARPGWRASSDDPFIEQQLQYTAALRSNPLIDELVDTTSVPIEQSVDAVAAWIHRMIA